MEGVADFSPNLRDMIVRCACGTAQNEKAFDHKQTVPLQPAFGQDARRR